MRPKTWAMIYKKTWLNLKGGLLAAVLIALGPLLGSPAWYLLIPALLLLGSWGRTEPRLGVLHLSVAGLLFAACVVQAPDLSDDYHRYLWEGFVANQGYSPYEHAPNSLYDELDHPSEGLVNHDSYTAIYPPMAQYLFRLTDLIGSWKLVILTLLVAFCVRAKEREQRLLLVFSPIVLIEGVWNAHLDVIGVVPAFFLVAALDENKPVKAGLALALMVGIKLLPVLFFPFCFLHFKGRDRWRFAAWAVLPVLLSYLPYMSHLPALFDSFRAYANTWQFNNAIYEAAILVMPVAAARMTMGIALISLLVILLVRPGGVRRKLCMVWMLLILLSPTFFPWYLLWLVPLVPLERRLWLHLAYGASFLSYLILIDYRTVGVWQHSWWWLLPEWLLLVPCFAIALGSDTDPSP